MVEKIGIIVDAMSKSDFERDLRGMLNLWVVFAAKM